MNRLSRRGIRLYSKLILLPICLVAIAAGVASPAYAGPPSTQTVNNIVIENAGPAGRVTLTLTFVKGVSLAESERIRSSLSSTPTQAVVTPAIAGTPMWCGSFVSQGDSNGSWSIQYYCGTTRTLPWGFQLSVAIQAIIVGNVSERGLSWWRNGAFAGQNAPHTVPPSYLFHGTMTPVYAGNQIDYSDYFSFRHNIGGGGSGAISLAGTVTLMN